MIFVLSKAELRQAQVIEESYKRLILQADERERSLRPEEPAPKDPSEYSEWLDNGSPEWRKARERKLELMKSYNESMRDYINSVYDEHFKKVAKNTESILESAYEEIDAYIEDTYRKYEKVLKTGRDEQGRKIKQFQAREVRAMEDGKSFLLDSESIIEDLSFVVSRHLKALEQDEDSTKLINDYIIKAVADSQYITSEEGVAFGVVTVSSIVHETTEEDLEKRDVICVRPKDYVTTVDKLSLSVFNNKVTKPLDAEGTALWNVTLSAKKSKTKTKVQVALDYRDLVEKGVLRELPEVTPEDWDVHDAILTMLFANNFTFSKKMIYRAMTGKMSGTIKITDEADTKIEKALLHFKGMLDIEYVSVDKDGNEAKIIMHEPMVTYNRGEGYINGKYIDDVITIPRDERFLPPLYKWAIQNNNEIDTRDITLLDVPRLNNGKESSTIKMCLYRRLIRMRNIFERKKGSKFELKDNQGTIRYDYVYEALGLTDPDANKRRLVKDKIDRCMKYWKDKGFIADYEHKRDKKNGNNFYAVRVYFLKNEVQGD